MGDAVGRFEGPTEGTNVGSWVGVAEGWNVGDDVGVEEGSDVGTKDGFWVGANVGEVVGMLVGFADGLEVAMSKAGNENRSTVSQTFVFDEDLLKERGSHRIPNRLQRIIRAATSKDFPMVCISWFCINHFMRNTTVAKSIDEALIMSKRHESFITER